MNRRISVLQRGGTERFLFISLQRSYHDTSSFEGPKLEAHHTDDQPSNFQLKLPSSIYDEEHLQKWS